jgi:hypothetical protein
MDGWMDGWMDDNVARLRDTLLTRPRALLVSVRVPAVGNHKAVAVSVENHCLDETSG